MKKKLTPNFNCDPTQARIKGGEAGATAQDRQLISNNNGPLAGSMFPIIRCMDNGYVIIIIIKFCYRNRNIVCFEQDDHMVRTRNLKKLFLMVKTYYNYYSLSKQILFTLFLYKKLYCRQLKLLYTHLT